ncbi:hypothetical protein [Candidatus Sororendozoicomonas aggregata]|uniref:hypothetical protein n=1 Tax=Candidatus Sororendozoicomonas aggregata TaxID=3073239 RepID=UPI002ED5708D
MKSTEQNLGGLYISFPRFVLQRQSFDPFGQRRNPTDWQALLEKDPSGFDSKLTTRGFTGHEQLDEVGLIQMPLIRVGIS